MAGWRFWARVLGDRYNSVSKQAKPLFMERRLDNIYAGDKGGEFGILDALVRTLGIEPLTGKVISFGLPTVGEPLVAVVAGNNFNITIIPPDDRINEVWLIDRITIDHTDNAAEDMICELWDQTNREVLGNNIINIFEEGGLNIPNNEEWPVFPVYHDAVNNHNHVYGQFSPLMVRNNYFLFFSNATPMTDDRVVTIRYIYRRVYHLEVDA